MTPLETEVLTHVLGALAAYDSRRTVQGVILNSDIQRYGFPYRPSTWRQEPLTARETKRYSRAIASLEAAGILHREDAWGSGRTTHLQLANLEAALAAVPDMQERRADIERTLTLVSWKEADDRA